MNTNLKYIYLSSICLLILSICFSCSSRLNLISDLTVCDQKNEWKCLTSNSVFASQIDTLYCLFKINSPEKSETVKVIWYYLGNSRVLIKESKLELQASDKLCNFESTLERPQSGWPTGVYEVKLEPISKDFKTKTYSFQII